MVSSGSSSCGIEEAKRTATAVPNKDDSAGCVPSDTDYCRLFPGRADIGVGPYR
jgi:hypothetical protein